MHMTQAQARFSLTIRSYPNERSIADVCRLIYQTTDPKLIASLSSLPYLVGRSFSAQEAEALSRELQSLKVSFHFKSPKGDLDIDFNPDAKTSSEESMLSRGRLSFDFLKSLQRKTLYRGLFAIGALSLSAIVAKYSLDHWDGWMAAAPKSEATNAGESTNYRAKIEWMERSVEFRRERELVWHPAELKLSLFDSDAIRTFDNSSAILKYREGSAVSVRPNTLMVIGAQTNESERSIDLEDGSVQAHLKASAQPVKLSIHTKAGTLEMQSPKPGEADSKVETSIKGTQLKVAVTQGNAVLKPAKADLPKVELKSLQQVEASPEKIAEPQVFQPTLQVFTPKNDVTIVMDPQAGQPIEFSWENLGEGATYTLIVASDEAMRNVLLKQESTVPSIQLNYLDLGDSFWRIAAKFGSVDYLSPVMRIHVQKHNN